jgi:mannosyltransferase
MNTTPDEAAEPGKSSRSRNFWIAIAVVTTLAAWLRAIALNAGLWWDEIYFLVVSVRHPLWQIVTVFPGDNQHPLYSVLAWLSVGAFGEHAWTLRLPAYLFGVATIPMLYLLGITVTSRREAFLAASFVAVSYHHVWFSQDARGYSMLAFFAITSTYFLLRAIRTERRSFWIGYALAAAFGAYTHLTMMFLLASHFLICLAVLWSGRGNRAGSARWKLPLQALLLTAMITLVLYAPILTQVQNFFLHRPSSMKAVSTPRWALGEAIRVLIVGLGTQGILLVVGFVVLCGAWSYWKENRVVFASFALPAVFTALGALLSRGTMYPRFYFYLIGFAVLILVRGVFVIPAWIAARFPGSAARLTPALQAVFAVAILAASAVSLERNYKYPKQDFEGAMRFVNAAKGADDIVVTAGASTYPYDEYYAARWESAETADRLREMCRRGKNVWIVYTFPRYLEAGLPEIDKMVHTDFSPVRTFPGTVGDGDVFVSEFQPGVK